jgi:hypothetical protein
MGGFRAGSAGVVAAAVVGCGAVAAGALAPAYADDTVIVQGTAFPDPARASLSLVGCDDLYQRTDESVLPMIGLGPGRPPAGRRSLGFDPAGGNAVGALFTVGSMLTTTTASMAVNSPGQAVGVAYAGYQEPADAGTSFLWLGRAELVTPGGAWQTIDATTQPYTWTKYDMRTRQPVTAGPGVPSTVAVFAAAHGGDGPGVYTIGFGCDGTAFSMDQMSIGSPGAVTTYDIEGLRTRVTITAQHRDGDGVTITGQLHTVTGDPVPHATMILEQRQPDSSRWTPVLVADVESNGARATVQPTGKTFYRWRFVERPLAEGSVSMPLLLDVWPTLPAATPTPTPSQSPFPTDTPTDTSTDTSTDTPTDTPTDRPSDSPSHSPSSAPSDEPSSGSPSPSSTPSATEAASDSASASASADPSDTPSPSDLGSEATPRHR